MHIIDKIKQVRSLCLLPEEAHTRAPSPGLHACMDTHARLAANPTHNQSIDPTTQGGGPG